MVPQIEPHGWAKQEAEVAALAEVSALMVEVEVEAAT